MNRTLGTTLPAILRERAKEVPDRVHAIDIEGETVTYAQAVARMDDWAAFYERAGVRPGDHVVTMQYNTLGSLCGWLGLASIGAIEAPINTDYRGALLVHALNITRAPLMLLTRQYLERVIEVADELLHLKRVIVLDSDEPVGGQAFEVVTRGEFFAPAEKRARAIEPALWDIATILFTSGTTGPSKAVRIPWGQLYASAVSVMPFDDLREDEVFYNPGPTYHVGAKLFPLISALLGARHLMRPYISRTQVGDDLRRFGVTSGGIIPPLDWLEQPPRADDANCALRSLLLPVRIARIEEFKKRFGVRSYTLYNMTEISNPIADPDWDVGYVNEEGLFSCGKLRTGYPGYEIRVVDEHDQPVPPGVVGELIVRTSVPWTLNAGYLNNPEATAAAWRNGWFHTGDAFSYDAEGRYYFRDRIKDCIRRHAENISSFEVEFIVRQHPDVADCAAVAARLSNYPAADEEIRLFAVRREGSALAPEDLVRWLIPRMPRFMVPRFVEFADALPVTPTMKVQKAVLRSRPLGKEVWDREASGVELPR